MAGPESVPTYPQAEDSPSFPTFKELLFGEAPSREVESKSHGTTLLDTNIVRNTRDLWLNGFGWQEASIECRLGNLILGPGPGLGEVVALYGAAERAWKRRTRELNAREFFEHVLACSDLFGNRALAVEVFTRGRVPGKEPRASTVLDQMVAGGDLLFHDFVEEFVSTQVEPRYCVLLKIHEALISSRDQNAALGFIDYCTDVIDFAPGLELVLDVTLLAPSTMLTQHGKAVRKVAGVVVKPGNNNPHRAAWGAAWDLTFVRVRKCLDFLTHGFSMPCKPPFRIVTAEGAIAAIHDSVKFGPTMNDVLGITAVAPSAEPGILYTDDRLMAAGSKLSNRFDNLIYERMVTKISRPNPDESQARERINAEIVRFGNVFPERDIQQ